MDGTRIFVDFKSPEGGLTNWQQEFDKQINRCCIRFNDPHQGPVDQWENEEYRSVDSTYQNMVFVEAGET